MRLYCTLIDKCGWYLDVDDNEPFICEECGSIALPWVDKRLEENGNIVSATHNRNNIEDSRVEHNSTRKPPEDTDTSN